MRLLRNQLIVLYICLFIGLLWGINHELGFLMKPKLQVCTLFLSVYKRTGIKDYFLLSMNLQVCVNIVVARIFKVTGIF